MTVSGRPARTWIVSTTEHPTRTEEVDHLARSADGGLSYATGDDIPTYLGVWTSPDSNTWHLYSDYPPSQHEKFGWAQRESEATR
ncbi:hypothetical protein ACWKSP_26345 [Micromonosporaceae bacterium Da 78-11]